MKISTFIGILISLFIVLFAVYNKGDLQDFVDITAVVVTLGGTLVTIISTYSISDFFFSFKRLFTINKEDNISHDDLVDIIVSISKDSRSLTFKEIIDFDEVQQLKFLRSGLNLITDNIPSSEIALLLEKESLSLFNKDKKASKVFGLASNISPMFGMIGTVIGLISMLSSFEDPTIVPKAMSLALVTTLYGLVLSVVFFRPLSGKLSSQAEKAFINRKIIIEGIRGMLNKKNSELIKAGLEKIYA